MIGGTQRQRLIKYMRKCGPISCQTARCELGIEALPARVMELKKNGFDIRTEMTQITAANGKKKTLAVYRLFEE